MKKAVVIFLNIFLFFGAVNAFAENRVLDQQVVKEGKIEEFKIFLEEGGDVREAFNSAAVSRNTKILEFLLEKYPNMVQEEAGERALANAILVGNFRGVWLLLKHKVPVNSKRRNPLITAIKFKRDDIVKMLLENGADINLIDNEKNTPLLEADKRENKEMVNYLLSKGAKNQNLLNQRLMAAAKAGNSEEIISLLEQGANINAKYKDFGWTALSAAVNNKDLKTIEILVDNGADINANDSEAFMLATSQGNIEIATYLIKKGADVNAQKHGRTVLFRAVEGGYNDLIKMLIKNGADIKNSGDVLSAAAGAGHTKILALLLKNGAEIQKNGLSALISAASNGYLEAVKFLVEMGAKVDPGKDGITPLMAAATQGRRNS